MFEFDQDAVTQSQEILEAQLEPVDLVGLDAPLLSAPGSLGSPPTHEHVLAYTDALVDLRHLLDEIRFGIAMACLLIWDFRLKVDRGEATDVDLIAEARHRLPINSEVPFPAPVLTFLAVYGVHPPTPDQFFVDPHQHFGQRVLGSWYAGQLLDSSMFRSVAALDRVVTMLWSRAGLPLRTAKGRERFPAFVRASLTDFGMSSFYGEAALRSLTDLEDLEIFADVKTLRNGFTHSRRGHFESAGERLVSYQTDVERIVVKGGTPALHINLAVGFYALLIRPAVEISRQLINASSS